jgi:hypothetical protein
VDNATIRAAIDTGGVIALLLIILVGGAKRAWVFGWTYRDVARDRDHWRALVLGLPESPAEDD